MKRKVLLFSLCLSACLANSYAEKATSIDKDNTEKTTEEEPKKKSRLTLGGYGEAVYTRNFYSDNITAILKQTVTKTLTDTDA